MSKTKIINFFLACLQHRQFCAVCEQLWWIWQLRSPGQEVSSDRSVTLYLRRACLTGLLPRLQDVRQACGTSPPMYRMASVVSVAVSVYATEQP